jgi:hypothetical protein
VLAASPATLTRQESMARPNPKKILRSSFIGERGMALVHDRVSEMGFLWTPSGQVEAGIDGTIEVCDADGAPTNSLIRVQVKATEQRFVAETDEGFTYLCDERDLSYWLRGNAPVVLVVTRPPSQEAYWASIKDSFCTSAQIAARKITFDKKKDRFDQSSASRVARIGIARDAGVYLAAAPKTEMLDSNLLTVEFDTQSFFGADVELTRPKQLWEALRATGEKHLPSDWIVRDGRLWSFRDLAEHPWSAVCEKGTVERYDLDEWSESDDPVVQRYFVELLNAALGEAVYREVGFDRDKHIYYFKPTRNLKPRRIVSGAKRRSRRTVFQGYESKTTPGRIAYYRHSAFEGHFRRFDGRWYLEITPTYRFTSDGFRRSRYEAERLKKIKGFEHNDTVRRHVLMWTQYLRGDESLLADRYAFLRFGELLSFVLDVGINDDQWLAFDEQPSDDEDDERRLF